MCKFEQNIYIFLMFSFKMCWFTSFCGCSLWCCCTGLNHSDPCVYKFYFGASHYHFYYALKMKYRFFSSACKQWAVINMLLLHPAVATWHQRSRVYQCPADCLSPRRVSWSINLEQGESTSEGGKQINAGLCWHK